jgi:DNA-binding transcriptional ArsR family regulator
VAKASAGATSSASLVPEDAGPGQRPALGEERDASPSHHETAVVIRGAAGGPKAGNDGDDGTRLTCKYSLAYCSGVSDVFKALADQTRRRILDELTERNGQTLFEICSRLATKHQLSSSRQAISQHLEILEAAGLIETRREGRYKFHYLNTLPLERIADRWLKPGSQEGT